MYGYPCTAVLCPDPVHHQVLGGAYSPSQASQHSCMCSHSTLMFFLPDIHIKEKLEWHFLWLVTYEKLFCQNLSNSHRFSSSGVHIKPGMPSCKSYQPLSALCCLAKDGKGVHQPLRICPYCSRSLPMVLHHSTPPHCFTPVLFSSPYLDFFSLYRCFAARHAALLRINCVFRSLFFQAPKGFCAHTHKLNIIDAITMIACSSSQAYFNDVHYEKDMLA